MSSLSLDDDDFCAQTGRVRKGGGSRGKAGRGMGGVDRGEGKGGIGEEKSEGGKACVSAVAQNSYFGRLLERAVNSGGCMCIGGQVGKDGGQVAGGKCPYRVAKKQHHLVFIGRQKVALSK